MPHVCGARSTPYVASPHIYRKYVKRVLDIGVSACAMLVASPFVIVACAAIRAESPGTPLLRQVRIGRDGIPFGMWKLRTMVADAEVASERYLSQEQQRAWKVEHKVSDDPRVTRVGHLLRKSSLDEIPQLINVLVGEMSLVGPRPVTHEELANYAPDELEDVLSIRPGVTGWWQTVGRNGATWSNGRRQAMEAFYARNLTARLDARILLRTIPVVLYQRNA